MDWDKMKELAYKSDQVKAGERVIVFIDEISDAGLYLEYTIDDELKKVRMNVLAGLPYSTIYAIEKNGDMTTLYGLPIAAVIAKRYLWIFEP